MQAINKKRKKGSQRPNTATKKGNAMTASSDELVGQLTLVMMALFGLMLYSLALTVSSGAAVLELCVVWTHLAVALLGGAAQLALAPQLDGYVPGLAHGQTALLGGLALGATCAGVACSNGDACEAYFPAALLPKASAIAIGTWAWVVFVTSLGAQSAQQGLSLGFTTPQGAWTALAAACLLPAAALQRACPRAPPAPNPAFAWLVGTAFVLAQLGLAVGAAAERGALVAVGWALQLVALITAAICVSGAVPGGLPLSLSLVLGLALAALSVHLVLWQVLLPWWRAPAPTSRGRGPKVHP